MKNAQKIWIAFFALVALLAVSFSFIGTFQRTENNGESDIFYWTGAGSDAKWSSAANWNQGKVPGEGAEIIFDSNSKKDSVIDQGFHGEIASFRIEDYDARIVQNKNLRISGDYYQDSGDYELAADLEVQGNFTQKDPSSFTVKMGEMKVAGEFDISDGFAKKGEAATVWVNNFGEWRLFSWSSEGKKAYYAKKEEKPSTAGDVWSFYNATNAFKGYISQEKGWTLSPLDGSWNWRYVFMGIERAGRQIQKSQNLGISAEEAKVTIQRGGGVKEWYENTYKGIEQGFSIDKKPEGEGDLVLSGQAILKNLVVNENSPEKISLFINGVVAFEYSHLSVLDSKGKELNSRLEFNKTEGDVYKLNIIVEDADAEYPIVIDPISSTPDRVCRIDFKYSGYGRNATYAGDVNGDGIDDALITALNYIHPEDDEGAAFVYYGTTKGLSEFPAWSFETNVKDAELGVSASTAGDVNKDGYDDIIIGAEKISLGEGINQGKVYVFYGSANGPSTVPDWTYESTQADAYLGHSVSSAGDVNKDGYDDVIIGAYGWDEGGWVNRGKVMIFHGSASGLSSVPNTTILGDQCAEWFGFSVSKVGDFDKDGYGDIIIGAPYYDNGQNNEGAAILYRGSAGGVITTPFQIFEINSANAFFGNPVSPMAYVNDDAYPDLLIGASRYDGVKINKGALFAFYGSASGFPSVPSWQFFGEEVENAYLGSSFRSIGDFNKDGFDDAVAGACMYTNGATSEGKSMLFYGSPTGLASTPAWQIEGDMAGSQMGWGNSGAGDVNGDGISDFFVTAHYYDDLVTGGRAYLYYGFTDTVPTKEICNNGIDDDGDGFKDSLDPDCDLSVDKNSILVTVSTVDQDNWYDDVCNKDTNGDGILDDRDKSCVGLEPADKELNSYLVCDDPASSNIPDYVYFRDYDKTVSCDRDKVSDDYYSTDSNNPVYIQPTEKNFTIKADAADSFGIQSIKIEWMSDVGYGADFTEWLDSNPKKHSFTCNTVSSCSICVKGGSCGEGHDVINYFDLGIPATATDNMNRMFFRVTVLDNNDNAVTTGWDHNTASPPVLDKYWRLVMCSSACPKTCVPVNNPPSATLTGYDDPSNFCSGLDYTLRWNFNDPDGDLQEFYSIEIRKKGTTSPVYSAVRQSSNNYCRLFSGFLDGGDIGYGGTYEWRVKVYDDDTRSACRGTSDWTEWSDMTKSFTTPLHAYPKPSFTLKNPAGADCTTTGNCGYLQDVIMDGSASQAFSSSIASYSWYVDDMSNVFSTANPSFKQFLESEGVSHRFKLKVTDSDGYSCTTPEVLVDLEKPHARWNEVAPTQ